MVNQLYVFPQVHLSIQKILMEAYSMPDTLVSASVENIMIYLPSLLVRNTWVICSFCVYKGCYYGHFSHMCLPELLCRRFS